MDFKILIKPIVFVDAEEAVLYYEKKLLGLGKRFYEKFLTSLNKIHETPFTYSFVKGPVRRCRIEKFPYKIFTLLIPIRFLLLGYLMRKEATLL